MVTAAQRVEAPIERLDVAPTRFPRTRRKSDGTLEWDSTTVVVVHAAAAGKRGLGYTYGHAAAAAVIHNPLRELVDEEDAFAIPTIWEALGRHTRNTGRPGIAATAISAIDAALWDLKARLLELPLCTLLGAARISWPSTGAAASRRTPPPAWRNSW